MKELIFGSYTLQYETLPASIETGHPACTNFYLGTETVTKKKWVFYGPTYEKTVPKLAFTIHADTDNTRLSKEWWREKIGENIAVLNRAAELERGELI